MKKCITEKCEMIKGNIRRYATVLINRSRGEQEIVAVTGYNAFYDSYTFEAAIAGGAVCRQNVVEVLDNENYYLDSPVFTVHMFYKRWKAEDWYICPHCRKQFVLPILDEDLECNYCKGKYEYMEEHNHEFKFVELTHEQVRDYNGRVAFKKYKGIFENNTKGIDDNGDSKGWVSEDMCEFLSDHARRINNYKVYLTLEQLNDLRAIYVKCYDKARKAIYKRYKNQPKEK